jgi:hypothetical protein
VRAKGLEPPHLTAPDPKSGVSTNSTTPAWYIFFTFFIFNWRVNHPDIYRDHHARLVYIFYFFYFQLACQPSRYLSGPPRPLGIYFLLFLFSIGVSTIPISIGTTTPAWYIFFTFFIFNWRVNHPDIYRDHHARFVYIFYFFYFQLACQPSRYLSGPPRPLCIYFLLFLFSIGVSTIPISIGTTTPAWYIFFTFFIFNWRVNHPDIYRDHHARMVYIFYFFYFQLACQPSR